MLEQETAPYWKHFFTGVPAPGGCWMVLTPAVLSLALDAKGMHPALATFLQNPWTGVFTLLFVGSLMASRLPTISLKHLHVTKGAMPLVLAGLLLLVAFLVKVAARLDVVEVAVYQVPHPVDVQVIVARVGYDLGEETTGSPTPYAGISW